MFEKEQAVQVLADALERLGAPFGLPEDWILLSDDDDLRFIRRPAAKKILAQAKKETARRWLFARFDAGELELELLEDYEGEGDAEFEERLLKQRAVASIDNVVSQIESWREQYKKLADEIRPSAANEATIAARLALGYPKEPPSRSDCFDEDVRRQCRRAVNQIYGATENSTDPVVYVISIGSLEFVKIGFTTCLEQRLRSLRTASHVEPVTHLAIPGTRSLERELHKRFASARHNREWFRLTEEIEAFIAAGSPMGRAKRTPSPHRDSL